MQQRLGSKAGVAGKRIPPIVRRRFPELLATFLQVRARVCVVCMRDVKEVHTFLQPALNISKGASENCMACTVVVRAVGAPAAKPHCTTAWKVWVGLCRGPPPYSCVRVHNVPRALGAMPYLLTTLPPPISHHQVLH